MATTAQQPLLLRNTHVLLLSLHDTQQTAINNHAVTVSVAAFVAAIVVLFRGMDSKRERECFGSHSTRSIHHPRIHNN